MIDLGRLDLRNMSDMDLRRTARIMKQNGQQLLAFNEQIAEEQSRRRNGRD